MSNDSDKKKPKSYYTLEKYDEQKVVADTCKPPSIKEQKEKITKEMLDSPLGKNEVWCLVEKRWLDSWKTYVIFEKPEATETTVDSPGPINNDLLLENALEFEKCVKNKETIPFAKIKADCDEGAHYEMVPLEVWENLLTWYGGQHDGYAPTIARYTYKRRTTSTRYNLDTRPFYLKCAYFGNGKKKCEFKEFRFCKFLTFKEVMKILNKHWDIDITDRKSDIAETQMWSAAYGTPWKRIDDNTDSLYEFEDGSLTTTTGRQFILEPRNLSEKFQLNILYPKKKKSYQYTSRSSSSSSSSSYSSGFGSYYGFGGYSGRSYGTDSGDGSGGTPGATGMSNLGNTCYMNSAIQCLTKIPAYRDYFLSGDYKKDINKDNPLGYKGEVANAFGDLMKLVWSGKHSSISPRGFKSTVGRYRDAFAGFGQQDSHEIISFLLDSVHEDLNRVKKKPTTEPVNAKGRPDEEVARENWETYKLRNDSIITESFQGQLRSEVVCPSCLHCSVKFDPFTFLSVPVPGLAMRKVSITVVFLDPTKNPVKFKVNVKKSGLIWNLRENLSKMCGIESKRLAIAEIFRHSIFTFYCDNDRLNNIKDHETIAAFELASVDGVLDHETYMRGLAPFGEFQVVQKEIRNVTYSTFAGGSRQSVYEYNNELSPWPFILYVPNEKCTAKEMYDRAFFMFRKYVTEEGKDELKLKYGIDVDDEKDRSKFFPLPSQENLEEFEKIKKEIQERIEKEEKEEEEKKKKMMLEKDAEEEDGEFIRLKERPPTPPKEERGEGDDEEGGPEGEEVVEGGAKEVDGGEKKEEEEVVSTPCVESNKERPLLFKIVQYSEGSNYHSSSRGKKGRDLFYSSHQTVNVPPHPERKSSGYYSFYSPSRDKYHIKFEMIIPDGFEKYLDLKKMLDVEKYVAPKELQKKKKDKVLTLSKCIEKFSEKEVLTKQNTFYCSRCRKHVEATKKIDIWNTNEILIIQLKRFQNTSQYSSYRSKIDTLIHYPLELDMEQHCTSKECKYKKYRLFAVSNHYGGLGGGHYTANAYAPKSGEGKDGKYQWYNFNDSFVGSSSGSSSISAAGYVLFYAAVKDDEKN